MVGNPERLDKGLASRNHPFIPNSSDELKKTLLRAIGIESVDALYSDIPAEVLLNRSLKIEGLDSEQEVRSHLDELLVENKSAADFNTFLGGGIYNHYIPAAVKAIIGRTEFQTSYTPYQAEISQGLLQALFEFESMMADLTAMDAVNSSLYDGSTALGEAVRMAVRTTGRYKVLIPRNLHPDKMSVLRNYTEPVGIKLVPIQYDDETGGLAMNDLLSKIDLETAAVYTEVPNFFGILDPELVRVPSISHEKGALAIVGFDPISLAGLKAPGEYGADIVIAEGQSIATEMNFGGPSLGIIGCRGEGLLRQIPGRLIGMTNTIDGKQRAFSMVLQTREQHIRREKATSNICTNEALLGVAAATYLALMGAHGLRELFETILTRTNYAIKRLSELPHVKLPRFDGHHYQDFVLTFKRKRGIVSEINKKLLSQKIHGGKSLVEDFPELGESSLYCVTEVQTPETIDRLRAILGKLLEER